MAAAVFVVFASSVLVEVSGGQRSGGGGDGLFGWMRCYRCESCGGVKQLWLRDRQRGRMQDEVGTNYNVLETDGSRRLNRSSCEGLDALGEAFVMVQNGYSFSEWGEWASRELRPSHKSRLRAIVFDKPYEIGFTRGYMETALEWERKFETEKYGRDIRVVYTGMDAAKTDGKGNPRLRHYNLCLTFVLRDEALQRRNGWRYTSDVTRTSTRFVALINKAKPWRFWFLARLFELGLIPLTAYTTKVRPTACSFYDTGYNSLKGCDDREGLERQHGSESNLEVAVNFSRSVGPRTYHRDFYETMLHPRGRIHLILESRPASSDIVADRGKTRERRPVSSSCNWEERLTEKSFEALAFGHPFIIVSTNLALDLLRAYGFKTFAPCIDESYASIRSPDLRMRAAAREVERISKLSDSDYWHLYDTCLKPIADHNRQVFLAMPAKQARQRLYAYGMIDAPAFDLSAFQNRCDDVAKEFDIDLHICRI